MYRDDVYDPNILTPSYLLDENMQGHSLPLTQNECLRSLFHTHARTHARTRLERLWCPVCCMHLGVCPLSRPSALSYLLPLYPQLCSILLVVFHPHAKAETN